MISIGDRSDSNHDSKRITGDMVAKNHKKWKWKNEACTFVVLNKSSAHTAILFFMGFFTNFFEKNIFLMVVI